jgi:hypothetical protein
VACFLEISQFSQILEFVEAEMAENPLPWRLDDLLTLAEDAADGAHQYETPIGVKQNDEAAIRAALAAGEVFPPCRARRR